MLIVTMEGAWASCGAIEGKKRQPKPSKYILNSTNEALASDEERCAAGVAIEMRHLMRLSGTGVPAGGGGALPPSAFQACTISNTEPRRRKRRRLSVETECVARRSNMCCTQALSACRSSVSTWPQVASRSSRNSAFDMICWLRSERSRLRIRLSMRSCARTICESNSTASY